MMKKLTSFFWRCSGAHIPFLKKSESESSKYAGIGATIFFTGVFASLAGGYALYTIFNDVWIAIGFGFLWGLLIFNLDRYIVSSMRKEGTVVRQLGIATPRIILAVIISLVIARPLEIKIFEKEIEAELIIMQQQTYARQEAEVKSRLQPYSKRLDEEIAALKNEITEKTLVRDRLDQEAREEADGTGGSKKRNAGPIYQLKHADAVRADDELEKMISKNEKLMEEKRRQRDATDSMTQATINNLPKEKTDGLANRLEALNRITAHSRAISLTDWFIMLLFIAIETAPVFVKLISSRGPYDNLMKIEEHRFEAQRIEELSTRHAEIKNRTQGFPANEMNFVNERLDILLKNS